jgi:hypothetical protein
MVIPTARSSFRSWSSTASKFPASNLAALLIDSEPKPAAGDTSPTQLSSGGNFEVPVAPLDPGVPLGDLIPPTELHYTPPEFEETRYPGDENGRRSSALVGQRLRRGRFGNRRHRFPTRRLARHDQFAGSSMVASSPFRIPTATRSP